MNGRSLRQQMPWAFVAAGLIATLIQCHGEWRGALLYDRTAIAHGEWWRLWTGHWVHFGWPHFVVDAGLFLILGWLLEPVQPALARFSLLVLPAFISLVLYSLDSHLLRYGGLSAVNLGLLLYLAGRGWQRNWTDWFWPAVLLVYAGELFLEATAGHGRGGGMIRFDDPEVQVATSAHLAGAAYALILLVWVAWRRPKRAEPGGAGQR